MMQVLVIAPVSLLAIGLILILLGYRWNWTGSAPKGLWRLSGAEIQVGDTVSICPPPLDWVKALVDQHLVGAGDCESGTVPFVKTVVAMAGDSYAIEPTGVKVNGFTMPDTVSARESLMSAEKAGQVEAGHALLINTYHPLSIDSRYFGPLDLQASEAQVIVPVWTW